MPCTLPKQHRFDALIGRHSRTLSSPVSWTLSARKSLPDALEKQNSKLIRGSLLSPIGTHRQSCDAVPRRTKRRKVTTSKGGSSPKSRDALDLEEACIYGLNACTRALESNLAGFRNPDDSGDDENSDQNSPVVAVLVCRGDSSSSSLLSDHFPALCHLSRDAGHDVRLVSLPDGAEASLGRVLAIPRVGCIALKVKKHSHLSPPFPLPPD